MTVRFSEQINEIGAAMALAQGELKNPIKDATNPHFKSKYADLAGVIDVVRPVFSKHGLSISQHPATEGNIVTVETLVIHKSGQYMISAVSSPVGKMDAQGIGSAITYCRRYSLAAVTGVAQDDDDGNEASKGAKEPPKRQDPIAKPISKPDPMEELCLVDFKAAMDKIGTVEELEKWRELKKDDINASLTGNNLVALKKYYDGVMAGLKSAGG